VPFVLRKAYISLLGSLKSQNIPFDGKEFLLTFDPVIKLRDIWADAALFLLFNKLRDDIARRQNFGRGLPVQLSFGYQVQQVPNVSFDVDYSIQQELSLGKKGKEKEENIFADLELEELK